MQPFKKATHDWQNKSIKERIKFVQMQGEHIGKKLSWKQAKEVYKKTAADQIFLNDKYQVNLHDDGDIIHLSIKTLDKQPVRDWREFQEIKNELVGPENEALELYPAESRIVDTANQYHLWVLKDSTKRIPVGFNEGRIINNESAFGAIQRSRSGSD